MVRYNKSKYSLIIDRFKAKINDVLLESAMQKELKRKNKLAKVCAPSEAHKMLNKDVLEKSVERDLISMAASQKAV